MHGGDLLVSGHFASSESGESTREEWDTKRLALTQCLSVEDRATQRESGAGGKWLAKWAPSGKWLAAGPKHKRPADKVRVAVAKSRPLVRLSLFLQELGLRASAKKAQVHPSYKWANSFTWTLPSRRSRRSRRSLLESAGCLLSLESVSRRVKLAFSAHRLMGESTSMIKSSLSCVCACKPVCMCALVA